MQQNFESDYIVCMTSPNVLPFIHRRHATLSVSLYNRSKTLLLENCAIVFMYWNIETMFLDMRIWLSIRDTIICQVWMSEHWSLFLYISILWRHEEIVRQRTSCTMLRHSVVMQHRVSDRPLSIISKENIHNVK